MRSQSGGTRGGGPDRLGSKPAKAPPPRREPVASSEARVVVAQVVDHYTKEPLTGATCEIVDPAGKTIARKSTDWQGMVSLDVKDAGEYTVKVTAVKRKPKKP